MEGKDVGLGVVPHRPAEVGRPDHRRTEHGQAEHRAERAADQRRGERGSGWGHGAHRNSPSWTRIRPAPARRGTLSVAPDAPPLTTPGVTDTRLPAEVSRRRTFAIISHPDAGKTTLTEKLLLYAGAIELAGAVRGRKTQRHAASDWMDVERERGISMTSAALDFDLRSCHLNLLDTPGHQDFSEDTYRTLYAVDSAVMVIDAAKGIETQTRKLFEVPRLRHCRSSRSSTSSTCPAATRSTCCRRSRTCSASMPPR